MNKFGYKNDDDFDQIKTYIFIEHDELKRNKSGSSDCSLKDLTTKSLPNRGESNVISNRDTEIVICYESISTGNEEGDDCGFMLRPCNHACLCGVCAKQYYSYPHHDQKCPLDYQQVIDVKKVYFS